jgi:hypothetical protein
MLHRLPRPLHRRAASRIPRGLAALAFAWPMSAAAITGVCPDGSVFVVKRQADVPCREAKKVEPSRVPPLRPENLPRAYLWEVHRQKIDENNPYNLIDRADKVRTLGNADIANGVAPPIGAAGGAAPGPLGHPEPALPQVAAAPPTLPPAPQGPRPSDLALTDGELRDLFYLVELSQKRAPATFLRAGKAGDDSLRVSIAHSQAFEERLRNAGAQAGAVLLFSAQPRGAERFLPNFTFVQGHLTYSPRRDDPSQLGLLSGQIGDLAADELVLGYVILPGTIDLTRPLDVYWDDRQLATTFRP